MSTDQFVASHDNIRTQTPTALYAEWEQTYANWKSELDALPIKQHKPPEIEALADRAEALCQRLAKASPRSVEDCAAILKWVAFEMGLGIRAEPAHLTAISNAMNFLNGFKS